MRGFLLCCAVVLLISLARSKPQTWKTVRRPLLVLSTALTAVVGGICLLAAWKMLRQPRFSVTEKILYLLAIAAILALFLYLLRSSWKRLKNEEENDAP